MSSDDALSDEPELFESGGEALPLFAAAGDKENEELASDVEVEESVSAAQARRSWASATLQLDPRLARLEDDVARLLREAAMLHDEENGDLPAFTALRSKLEALRSAPSFWPGHLFKARHEDLVISAERIFEAENVENVIHGRDRDEEIEFRTAWTDLEKRVDWLEKCVGEVEPGMKLSEVVQQLECSVRALDEVEMNFAKMRLQKLRDEHESLLAVETKLSKAEMEARKQIVDSVVRFDDLAESLPLLIGRLESLDRVHKSGERAILRLEAMEESTRRLEAKLNTDDDVLTRLEGQQVINWRMVKDNIDDLNARIDRLQP